MPIAFSTAMEPLKAVFSIFGKHKNKHCTLGLNTALSFGSLRHCWGAATCFASLDSAPLVKARESPPK